MKSSDLRLVKRHVLMFLLLSLLCISAKETFFPAFRTSVLASPEETSVAVDPPVIGASLGQYFTVNVTITSVTDLFSWGFKLGWPEGLLEVSVENITEGPFLKQGGLTGFAKKTFEGYIDVGCTLLAVPTGVNGSGTLATVTFGLLTAGNFTLDLYSVTLLARTGDSSLQVIGDWEHKDSPDDGYVGNTLPTARFSYTPHPTQYPGHPIVGETVTFNATESYDPDEPYDSTPRGIVSYRWDFDDGNVTTVSGPIITHVYETPGLYQVALNVTDDEGETDVEELTLLIQLHDINVINVTTTPTEVNAGSLVTVNVTVMNKGSVPEHFNVTTYYNHNPIKTEAEKNLQAGETVTISFSWNTLGVAEGDYQIWAEATNVEGEGNPQDNKFIDGTVTVKSAQESFSTNTIVGAVVAVAVGAIAFASLYAKKKRKPSNDDLAASSG